MTVRRTAGTLCDQTKSEGDGIGIVRVFCNGVTVDDALVFKLQVWCGVRSSVSWVFGKLGVDDFPQDGRLK